MKLRLFIFILVSLLPFSPAQADYFLWEDEVTGLTMTFPDTWKRESGANPDTILSVLGPAETGKPECKVNAKEDRRYAIFPVNRSEAIQKTAVSKGFWQEYLGRYDDSNFSYYDGAGLGRGFASFALASFNTHAGTVMETRKAILFASLYGNTMYVVECSALAHDYSRWEPDFRGIIKSIDFKKIPHEIPTGEYANFLKEAEIYFWAPQGPEGTTAY